MNEILFSTFLCIFLIFGSLLIIADIHIQAKKYKKCFTDKKHDDIPFAQFTGYTDPVKFYLLHNHFDAAAPNIGILGDYDKFKEITQAYIQDADKNAVIIKSKDKPIVRIIDDTIETSYVFIQTSEDLIGKKFRKYL